MNVTITPTKAFKIHCPACDWIGAALTEEQATWTGRVHVEQIHGEVPE